MSVAAAPRTVARITPSQLDALAGAITRLTGSPDYVIDRTPDGYALLRVVDGAAAATDVLGSGYIGPLELYERMHAWIRGYDDAMRRAREVVAGAQR